MKLESSTLIGNLVDEYPFLLEFLPKISPVFERLKDPEMRQQMGEIATLEMVSQMGGIGIDDLIGALNAEIERVTGKKEGGNDLGPDGGKEEKLQQLKSIIMDLHSGSNVEDVKQRFLDLATEVDPSEIARMEQELIDEGLPQEEIKKLCDVHVLVFKDSLDKKEELGVPPGHPVQTFMKENEVLEGLLVALSGIIKDIESGKSGFPERKGDLERMLKSISKLELHYLRKENQLFPLLEKHNISGPTQVMWALHDDIRGMLKEANIRLEAGDFGPFMEHVESMSRTMMDMIYKEEKVLFPMSLDNLSEDEWKRGRRGEEEIGYAWIKPDEGYDVGALHSEQGISGSKGKLRLDEGYLTLEQLNCMLKTLPIDISFVDADNKVAYYSATDERIFPRSPAVIGREVKNCHPPKSVHVVERILSEFKAGNKDVAEFWIQLNGKFIHIRYFAVRSAEGKFLGTLEVSQDATQIRKLEGNRRLLDWGD
ncbi:MAG: DUF438 domain-containing protein [Candidatus Thermoplasmatota archaeon]|nr:DUF438 domain-containing protein [Candidatus Thermoplasmatota archaeon]